MKRKFTLPLGLFLAFAFFYFLGQRLPINWDSAPRTGHAISHPSNDGLYHAAIWRELDRPANSEDLFDFLYTVGLDNFFKDSQLRGTLASRFDHSYPEDSDPDHKPRWTAEVVNRLGILKILGATFTPKTLHQDPVALTDFYRNILSNPKESWVVKRQALQALGPWMHYLTLEARDQILASQDTRAIRYAPKSETELMREASAHAY